MSVYGLSESEIDGIWNDIKDLTIKTLALCYEQVKDEFEKRTKNSAYNCYKILGMDILLDSSYKAHLIEINSRPALLDDEIDKQVNRPMMDEIIKIVGYHLPKTHLCCNKPLLQKNFQSKNIVGFEQSLYNRMPHEWEAIKKQIKFGEKIKNRENYLNSILEDLDQCDLRILIQMEEQRSQSNNFERIFPTSETFNYFPYFTCKNSMDKTGMPYYDKLLDAYETKYASQRKNGLDMIRNLCLKNIHL